MKANKPLRVGVVGCGQMAQLKHIPALLKIQDAQVMAICDKNEDLAKIVSERFHIGKYYTDFSEMLDKEKMDMVDICTLPQTHLDLSVQAMEAGCHVLTEKPMALSSKETGEMAEVAKVNQVELCVVHNELFLPVVMKARSMVEKGIIGDLIGISITDSIPRDGDLILNKEHWCHRLPGGIFGEMLPHPIYLAVAFMGSLEPIAVHSRKLSSYDWLVADELRVILEGKNGIATITESVNWAEDMMVLNIFGTKMNLYVDLWGSIIIRSGTGRVGRLSRGWGNISQGLQAFVGTASTVFNIFCGRHHSAHYTLIQRFINSLQSGTEPPVTMEEAREVVRLYEAITTQI